MNAHYTNGDIVPAVSRSNQRIILEIYITSSVMIEGPKLADKQRRL